MCIGRIFFSFSNKRPARLFWTLEYIHFTGTGSSGATVRLYVDTYEADKEKTTKSAAEMLAPCIDVALQISKLPSYTGRNEPTVIT